MSDRRLRHWNVAFVMLAILFAAWALPMRPAVSQPAAEKSPQIWRYTTATIAASELEAKLNELGNDGWEVFSILRFDSTLAQDANGENHIRAVQLQVTGRRRQMQ